MTPTRECDGCGEFKPVSEYLDGDSLCRTCGKAWAREEGEAQDEQKDLAA